MRTLHGWRAKRGHAPRTYHVVPVDDLCAHVETIACWCRPQLQAVEDNPDAVIVVHNSLDGRELVEQHGVN